MKTLPDNIVELKDRINPCRLCPRECGVDRTHNATGYCRTGAAARVATIMAHFGEEPMLVGDGGSGTIFFGGCNLGCVFCQNYDISHADCGQVCSPAQLAELCLKLASDGCENINFVTPTHVAHAVAEAVFLARQRGLAIPTVYNCGGYESVEVLRLLEGLIDIYMPDFKYADPAAGEKYSDVPDYPDVAAAALAEMFRQVGPIQLDQRGLARRGVLVRHLVLPDDLAGSQKVVDLVVEHAPGSAINIMAQYRPAWKAGDFPELLIRPAAKTLSQLRNHARVRGLLTADH